MKLNNSLFVIERARAEDAAALLNYLKIVGGETENLSFSAEGVSLDLEAEQDHLRIDQTDRMIDFYCRVSPGWTEPFAGKEYCEGSRFHTFHFLGKKVAIGLCGDLWQGANIACLNELKPDLVWWPVYTDYSDLEWNNTAKLEYAEQAGKINAPVCYVNSVCMDKSNTCEIAKGGAALFENGFIKEELPAGKQGILIVSP